MFNSTSLPASRMLKLQLNTLFLSLTISRERKIFPAFCKTCKSLQMISLYYFKIAKPLKLNTALNLTYPKLETSATALLIFKPSSKLPNNLSLTSRLKISQASLTMLPLFTVKSSRLLKTANLEAKNNWDNMLKFSWLLDSILLNASRTLLQLPRIWVTSSVTTTLEKTLDHSSLT